MTVSLRARSGSGTRPRVRGRSVWAACLAAALLAGAARAQDRATPREVRLQALSALQVGAYQEAIQHLRQLVAWYGDSEQREIVAEMEDVYYNLGLCHLLLGQFGDARAVFQTYLERYAGMARARIVAIFVGDSWRYERNFAEAVKVYDQNLATYRYEADLEVDILGSKVRCILAGEDDDWKPAEPLLLRILALAPDAIRRNWAATILTTLYLRELDLDRVYPLVPYLLQPDSFAARSVALNMAALEAGDDLFADDRYRDALWIYRLVYPYDVLAHNAERQRRATERRIGWLQRTPGRVRELLRAQELLGEIEAEIQALEQIPIYDPELFFRTARSYMETRRFREGGDLFYDLYSEKITELSEECLYLSFLCGTKLFPLDRAFERGEEYMRAYPAGHWYDELTLALAQLHANQRDWPNVLRVLRTALEVKPRHGHIVECLFLMGYASFMEEAFGDAVGYLSRVVEEFPGNDREPDAVYWIGMSRLFDRQYEEAAPYFDRIVSEFSDSPYVEDSLFRGASCDFGASHFDEAERKLLAFITRFPDSRLLGEAYLMLGDIAGFYGELEEAVRRFRHSVEHPLNIELYNYATFQAVEMMRELAATAKDPDAERRWRESIIEHLRAYTESGREEINAPMAVYWIGSSHWDLDEPEQALEVYQDAIEQFGHNRSDLGVDLIFEDWVGRTRNAPPELAERAWRGLRDQLGRAIAADQWTMTLRIQRILLFDPQASEQEKEILRESLLRERHLPHASPGVLEWILREASRAGLAELAERAAWTIVEDFTETDYALAARVVLAQSALEGRRYEEAIRHLAVIREVFATSREAAEALLILGNLHLDRGEPEEADQAFQDLLGVRGWRDLWPAALFGRGRAAEARGQDLEATAFYERIYVLYSGFQSWAARAYLARARALRRLESFDAARETVEEFLAYYRQAAGELPEEDFEELPEVREAREELAAIRRRDA